METRKEGMCWMEKSRQSYHTEEEKIVGDKYTH